MDILSAFRLCIYFDLFQINWGADDHVDGGSMGHNAPGVLEDACLGKRIQFLREDMKPTSSEIEEERNARLGKKPVLESSQSRTLRVWPLVKYDHYMVAND